ncbi:hypothetical protein EON81_27035 [bacterium]|nr:MAG: hypothetical protein EON81_27035 [bacterium]
MPAILFAAMALTQTVYAPADVPKNHWAFPAVNAMFKDGVLRGYPIPAKPMKLDSSAKFDADWAMTWANGMMKTGVLAFDPRGFGHARKISNYEFAVAVFAVSDGLRQRSVDPALLRKDRGLLPATVEAISRARLELVELELNPAAMVKSINEMAGYGGAFRG